MPTYSCFEDLPVWQSAKKLAIEVYRATSRPEFRADYVLVRQARAAALSVSSNIAEGFERGTTAQEIHFLGVARGSCGELRSQLSIAAELKYLNDAEYQDLHERCITTSSQITGFIAYLQSLDAKSQKSASRIKEDQVIYIAELSEQSNRERP